jgi:tRNA(Ile)-lysidine synthase
MIHITGKIPRQVAIAVSGGIDSMASLDFLRRAHDVVVVLHYNHGTPYAPKAEALVRAYCIEHKLTIVLGRCEEEMPAGVSKEAWWRDQRYKFFTEATDLPIITAHHLDDQVENYLFTALNGKPFLIPHKRDQFIRPFITTEKTDFTLWCVRKGVPTIDDPSNEDTKYRRNYIRHTLMPHVLNINPGIKKVIRKKVLDSL